jgi:uncharacterized protein YgiM (DUF1202 family)
MIGVSAFVAKVRAIADRNPTYRTGGVGKDGTCDCIGLVMGAMYELGHKKYDMHSSNYFARYQMATLKKVYEKDLAVGQILYRSRKDGGQLNARYQAGGRYYTGDKLDYYHAGVVTRVNPLEIIECTESGYISGIVISSDAKKWQYAGELKDVLYEGYEPDEREETLVSYKAIVTTEKDPLRVREWPETGTILGKVPKGRTVDVLAEAGDGWPKIRYNELIGYVSEQYLTPLGAKPEEEPEEAPQDDVQILPEDVANVTIRTIIIDSAGNTFEPVGEFTVKTVHVDGEELD